MDFGTGDLHRSLTPTEVIKKGSFGGTYFRDTYSNVNHKWYKNSWKEFDQLKNIDKKYYARDFNDVNLNTSGVKCGTSLRFWENKGWIRQIDPYGWFQWYFRYYLGRRPEDDQRQIKRWKGIVNRFKGILVRMIKNGKDSPKIRQILLHWDYELVCFFNIKHELLLV